MRKSCVLFLLAVILLLLGILETLSGFILWLALPHGGGRRGGEQIFWNLSRETWVDIHDWVAVALVALVIIHIAFHWKWLSRMFRNCCPFIKRAT